MNPANTVFDVKYGVFSSRSNFFFFFCCFAIAFTQTNSNLYLSPIYRRLIGRRFDDPTVKKDMETWPFKVIDEGGNPKVQVEYLGESKIFSPQEISSMILGKVFADA
jgi:hypothetical protein